MNNQETTSIVTLSDHEKRMIDGEEGLLRQKAIEFIIRYAKALGAPCLIDITKAHLFAGAHTYLRAVDFPSIGQTISKMHFCSNDELPLPQVACYAQTDSGPMDPAEWKKLGFSDDIRKQNDEYLRRYLASGVHLVGTCTPYLAGFVPLYGEHYVSTESHAIVFMNSLWGACANSDGIEAAWCSAFCGKTPYWGNHVPEKRFGNVLVEVQCTLANKTDWELFGFALGKQLPSHSIPVVKCKEKPDANMLRACFSALATTGGVEMCHIIGVTPEALDVDSAFGGRKPDLEIPVNKKDLSNSRDFLSSQTGDVKFVSLGCPHYTIDQLAEAASFLTDKKVANDVELQIWTSGPTLSVAKKCGYLAAIENAGGHVYEGSCPVLTDNWPQGVGLAFDSAKQANYMKPRTSGSVFYGNYLECLQAAVAGKWNGGM